MAAEVSSRYRDRKRSITQTSLHEGGSGGSQGPASYPSSTQRPFWSLPALGSAQAQEGSWPQGHMTTTAVRDVVRPGDCGAQSPPNPHAPSTLSGPDHGSHQVSATDEVGKAARTLKAMMNPSNMDQFLSKNRTVAKSQVWLERWLSGEWVKHLPPKCEELSLNL